jgi:DNA-binding FadR family transcriptional regulator
MLHEMIVKNYGNFRLEKIIGDLRDQVHSFRIQEGHELEVVPKAMKERWGILNSIKERDPDRAEKAVIHHIEGVKRRRLAHISD